MRRYRYVLLLLGTILFLLGLFGCHSIPMTDAEIEGYAQAAKQGGQVIGAAVDPFVPALAAWGGGGGILSVALYGLTKVVAKALQKKKEEGIKRVVSEVTNGGSA